MGALMTKNIYFKNKNDFFPILYVISVFGLQLALTFYFTFLIGLCLLPLLILAICPIVAYNHHHHHYNVFKQKVLNRLLESIMGFLTGFGPFMWTLHHNLGHHLNYMNQHPSDQVDESHWTHKNGSQMSRLRYTFHTYFYGNVKIRAVGRKRQKVYKKYNVMLIIIVMIKITFCIINPSALIYFVLVPHFMLLYTAYLTYGHHAGLHSKNHFRASRNIIHPLYNFFNFNLGYHTAHHIKPSLHWSKIPEFHKTIASEIPDNLIFDTFFISKKELEQSSAKVDN